MATTTDRTPARTAHAPTPTKGRFNAPANRDPHRGQRTKLIPVQIHRRGTVRGYVDLYLVGMMAMLAVVVLLAVRGLAL